ncbi:protein TolQ [Ahniella affigens]|uniref:Tol-Pal system protein TolQ n=1 Tax=Ahniella affigens TaxID=2021234 RepID=A0A2P1PY85_9GAMM|nr:protein TolQ [Ahniella affigens]AVP99805.1 protein TolQ [Ahniella affigens]
MTSELNLFALILGASLPVKLVMGLLLAASVASWTIIFAKSRLLGDADKRTREFEDRFWSGTDMAGLFKDVSTKGGDSTGLESIFEAGFREFARLRSRKQMDSRIMVEGAQRAMRAASGREMDRLEHRLEFLASVGSISPYVGLFGTVWGIMIAFQGLANVKEATIAMVAPGISEALIATAMGLFAAIPAVWAYNRFATKADRLASRYDVFQEEFSAILQRQAHVEENR